MELELIIAIKEVALEFIKIVAPATIAAVTAYKTASYQYKQKIAEIEKQNQFKAAQMIFDLQKQSFDDVAKGYKSITESIFEISGFLIGGKDLDESEYFLKIMKVYTQKLPFSFRKTYREFSVFLDQYSEEYKELQEAEKSFNSLGEVNIENLMDYAIKLEYIYSTLSHCSQIIISEKMDDNLSKFTANK